MAGLDAVVLVRLGDFKAVIRQSKGVRPACLVELPGIEPATENPLTCGNVASDDAKQRETTCGYARGVDGANTTKAATYLLLRSASGQP